MNKVWPDPIHIGPRAVGAGAPVLVVAEAGVNHNGKLATAIRLCRAASEAGADAVKFQAFSADRLVTAGAPAASYQRAADQRKLLSELELSPLELAQVKAECDALGLIFLATPFSPRDVANLHGMGVSAIKIASPDLANPPLLRIAAATGLPIIMSTGASTMEEVEHAVEVLSTSGCRELVLLHCVSNYPTPQNHLNLRGIHTLGRRFQLPVGLSDHTVEPDTASFAVAAGAVLLEKHLTLSRQQYGPDHFFSVEPEELSAYVGATRRSEAILGHGRREPSNGEQEIRKIARSSVVSAQAIIAGAKIERTMLTVKRPAGGIEPARLEEVVGKTAAADIPADTTLRWEMIQ